MIGVLALQGGYREHESILSELALPWKELRTAEDFVGLTGLILPGGESTVMDSFIKEYGLLDLILDFDGPVLGTCAGLILLARYGLLNAEVQRNAYGTQLDSFVAQLDVKGLNEPLRAHFIRAPKVLSSGPEVEILALHNSAPVVLRQGRVWATSAHPELTGDASLHRMIFS